MTVGNHGFFIERGLFMQLKQPSRRKTRIIQIIFIALLIVVGLIWMLTSKPTGNPAVSSSSTPTINASDVVNGEIPVGDYQATLTALQKKVDASRFEVKCNSSISTDPQTGKYNLMIGNTARNRYNCYVEIISKADNALLYRSPILQPGQYIPTANIEGQMRGTVDATADFIILDPKTNATVGKVVVAVTIQNRAEAGQS